MPVSKDEIDTFRELLEALGWRFEIDGPNLQVVVGDVPSGLTQHAVWQFVREWNEQRRLAAVEFDTVH